MRLCWVTNEQRYSRMYRYLFDEPASHVGVIFDFDGISLAVDLNRPFGRVWDEHHWLHKYNIVWTMSVYLDKRDEKEMYKACANYAVLRQYDMSGYYYGIIAGLKRKLLKRPLPTFNKWSKQTGSMCQEIVTPIVQNPIFKQVVPNEFDSTIFASRTPGTIMKVMQDITANNNAVTWVYHG